VAIPDAFESGNVVQQARQFKPGLSIIARAHSDEEFEHLRKHGASAVVMGENEMARAMLQPVPAAPPASPAPATAA
jgi:CPA2 family monovalent cation:H+ antiporter-2